MEKQMDEKGEDASARPDKRRRLCEPDVTVVVGGVEFKHYSQFLCGFSGFFDSALNSGMKEQHEKRVALQGDWDPEEWREVANFFDPSLLQSPDAAMVTKDNIHMLLPWFHYLEMTNLLKECDRCLRNYTLKDGNICSRGGISIGGFKKDSELLSLRRLELSQLCDSLVVCARYSFEDLKKDIRTHLEQTIEQSPDFFTLDVVETLVSVMSDNRMDTHTKESIWDKLKFYLPEPMLETSLDDLEKVLENVPVLLPNLIYRSMVLFALEKRDEDVLPDKIIDKVHNAYHRLRSANFIREIFQEYPGMQYTLSNNS